MKNTIRVRPDLKFDREKCIGCGACALVCPNDAVRALKEGSQGSISYDYGYCLYCRKCAYVCPQGAIEYSGVAGSGDAKVSSELVSKMEFEYHNCTDCGKIFLPALMLNKAESEMVGNEEGKDFLTLCSECRPRAMYARFWKAGKKG